MKNSIKREQSQMILNSAERENVSLIGKTAKIISLKNTTNVGNDNQHMTLLEIAELTGKQHKDLLKAIRNMEPAWVKVQGRKFALLQKTYNLPNGGNENGALLLSHQNRVPLHCHEVQR